MTVMQKAKEKLNEINHFIYFVLWHFYEDDCTYRASALAFTSLLAIVPLMSVGFAILSAFPLFHNLSGPIQDFIFHNFVPTTGEVVQEYLQLFVTQVSRLSMVGVIFLFITALLVMYTIEGSLNRIWRVSESRKGISAFLLYWAILSLAPIFLGFSLVASSYFLSMPFIRSYYAPSFLMIIIPYFLSFIGFTFLYVIVPNCKVKLSHGAYGAIIATILFESAKLAFAFYLTRYDTYQLLYGAFATIPIFFIWIYWVWIITLLGAEISYAFSVHHQRRRGTAIDALSHALLWLYQLWLAMREGNGVNLDTLINSSSQAYAIDVDQMLTHFNELQLIHTTQDGKYMLSRDLSYLTLYDFIQMLPYRIPNESELLSVKSPVSKHWRNYIQKADSELQGDLSITLDELFRSEHEVEDAIAKSNV